jgi:hypothetical protein
MPPNRLFVEVFFFASLKNFYSRDPPKSLIFAQKPLQPHLIDKIGLIKRKNQPGGKPKKTGGRRKK